MATNPIVARTIIGKSIAAMDSDGQKIYEEMTKAYETYGCVVVSFEGINLLATAFLNASLGQFILAASSPIEGRIRSEKCECINLSNPKMQSQIDKVRELALDSDFSAAHDAAVSSVYA